MSTVLVLTSSALGEASVSNHLVREAVNALQVRHPAMRVIARDLGRNPVPHLTVDSAAAIRGGEPLNEAQAKARALSDELIAELKAAEIIVIGAPMYNFGMASTLKSWFDHVLRAGVTFGYTENGPVGLLEGKRAIVIVSRGGFYSEGPAQSRDSQEPHLRNLLGFMGVGNVTFIRAEKLAFGPEARAQAIEAALSKLGDLIERELAA